MENTVHGGDTVKVHQKIKEGEKERIQIFEGIVIAIKNRGVNRSFTVRKIGADGIGVERVWALNSPHLAKIETKKLGKVRRAKLYFLRTKLGKERTDLKEKAERKKA